MPAASITDVMPEIVTPLRDLYVPSMKSSFYNVAEEEDPQSLIKG